MDTVGHVALVLIGWTGVSMLAAALVGRSMCLGADDDDQE
jgi:hypothetical protein